LDAVGGVAALLADGLFFLVDAFELQGAAGLVLAGEFLEFGLLLLELFAQFGLIDRANYLSFFNDVVGFDGEGAELSGAFKLEGNDVAGVDEDALAFDGYGDATDKTPCYAGDSDEADRS
jgi:hypothetical protein